MLSKKLVYLLSELRIGILQVWVLGLKFSLGEFELMFPLVIGYLFLPVTRCFVASFLGSLG